VKYRPGDLAGVAWVIMEENERFRSGMAG